MSDEVLIERVRRGMAEQVEGMRPRPETVERALAAPPRRSPSLGWLMPAVALAVAALVAIIAVTSLTHRAPALRGTAAVPPAARHLASQLAVLRRSQRTRDVLPPSAVAETESLTDHARVIRRLSRLVGSVDMGRYGSAKVYLIVQSPPRFPLHRRRPGPPVLNPRLGDVASIAFVGPFREEAAINGTAVAAGADQIAATAHGLTADPLQTGDLWGAMASIVPDGVKRVKWVLTRTGTDSGLPPLTVWPRVRNNVAIGKVAPDLQVYLSRAVWYGAGGRVLESLGLSSRLSASARKFKQALETSLHDPVAPALLRHFGVLRRAAHAPGLSRAAIASLIEPNPVDLNIARARFVPYAPTGARLWVVPGTQGIALRSQTPSMNYTVGQSVALSGTLAIASTPSSGKRTIVGLAPDGNRWVTVLLPGGGRRTARVIDNVYAITVPSGARTVLVRNSSGRTIRVRL